MEIEHCQTFVTITGPADCNATVPGRCRWRTGNTAPAVDRTHSDGVLGSDSSGPGPPRCRSRADEVVFSHRGVHNPPGGRSAWTPYASAGVGRSSTGAATSETNSKSPGATSSRCEHHLKIVAQVRVLSNSRRRPRSRRPRPNRRRDVNGPAVLAARIDVGHRARSSADGDREA